MCTVCCGTVVLVEWALSNPEPHHTLTLTLTLPLPLPLTLTRWAELSAAAEAEEASIRATWVSMAKVAWLGAAHAATHRSRGPPAGSRLPSGPERRALAAWVPKRGRCGALVPAQSRSFCCL